VYPSYDLTNDSLSRTGDSTRVGKYLYIDNQHNFRPHIITDVINITPDSIYRRIDHEYTLSHLMGLNTFKFVNIKYRSIHRDSMKLRASVFLTPTLKKSIRLQVQGVSKSNNFVGPGVETTFTNRNIFRGAEMFQLKLNGSYEMQIRSQQTTPLNSIELGGEVSISVPRFITPFNIRVPIGKVFTANSI
jgi:outer membrane protein insertion porin family